MKDSPDFLDKNNLKEYMRNTLLNYIHDMLEGVKPTIPPGKTQVKTGKTKAGIPGISSREYCEAQGLDGRNDSSK